MGRAEPIELHGDELDLGPFIPPGTGIVWGQCCAEPVPLVDAVLRHAVDTPELSAFVGLSFRDLSNTVPAGLRMISYGWLGKLGRMARLEVVPAHFSALPGMFARRELPGDVAMVLVSPPDHEGRCSLGPGVDYIDDALHHARTVIAEVNDQCPRSAGRSIAWDRIHAYVRTSRELLEAPVPTPGPTEEAIATQVAELVRDGDTFQVGVGALPEAILAALRGHRQLGVHSGMISDGVLDLIECGAVTGERKAADAGLTVTGAALGTRRLFDALAERQEIRLMPVSYTHAPATLARVGRLTAINSAMQVDLAGQVNSERVDDRRLGAVGGQVDFLRAAALSGGTPIVALPAKRIVPVLDGPVTTARSDVDWIVTEHGSCSLRGLSESRRRRELLRLAGVECAHGLTSG